MKPNKILRGVWVFLQWLFLIAAISVGLCAVPVVGPLACLIMFFVWLMLRLFVMVRAEIKKL